MLPTGNVEMGETPQQSAQRVIHNMSGVSVKLESATLIVPDQDNEYGEFPYCYSFLVKLAARYNHSTSEWASVATALEHLSTPIEREWLALAVKKSYETPLGDAMQ